MKYDDKVTLYNDEGKVLAEDVPIEALSPMKNPYMGEMYVTFKRTSIIDLAKLEKILRDGTVGWMTTVGQDEIKMPWYGFRVKLIEDAGHIADELKKMLQTKDDDGTEVTLISGGNALIVQLSEEMLRRSADYSPAITSTGVALGQIVSKMADLSPIDHPHRLGLLKAALFGRYPQTVSTSPGNVVSTLIKPPSALEGMGTAFRTMMINHVVALANHRTLDAVALATILEQGGQYEMGNSIGWYERNQLLTSAFQGFNANNLVLDMIKENASGTVQDVLVYLIGRALEDGVITLKGDRYPYVQPSGYKLYSLTDYPKWNAYACASQLAAVIVNSGAARNVQSSSAVLAYYGDMLAFEAGGLPDPDAGRSMGVGLGFGFYTHGLYGGAGPGAFTMEHVITRSNSGFLTPCTVAAMCLDAGTQIFKPSVTSGLYYVLREAMPLLKDPLKKVAEAAESVKGDI